MPKVGKKIPYVFVKWSGNNSKEYDDKEHWIPKTKVVNKMAKIGQTVRVMWYGKEWKGELLDENEFSKSETKRLRNKKEKVKASSKKSPKQQKNSGKILCIGSTPTAIKKIEEKKSNLCKSQSLLVHSTTPFAVLSPIKGGKVVPPKTIKAVLRNPDMQSPKKSDMQSPKKSDIKSPKKVEEKKLNLCKSTTLLAHSTTPLAFLSPIKGGKMVPPKANKAVLRKPDMQSPKKSDIKSPKRPDIQSPKKEGKRISPRANKAVLRKPDRQSPKKPDIQSPKKKVFAVCKKVSPARKDFASQDGVENPSKLGPKEFTFTDDEDSPHNIMKRFSRVSKMIHESEITPQTSPISEEESVFYVNSDNKDCEKTSESVATVNVPSARRSLFDDTKSKTTNKKSPKSSKKLHARVESIQTSKMQSSTIENVDKVIEETINRRSFGEMGNAGPALMARCLVKTLFTTSELECGYFRKCSRKSTLDPLRLEKIKEAVMNEFHIPPILRKSVWCECTTSIVQMLKYCRRQKKKMNESNM